jgi:hypothetical protein
VFRRTVRVVADAVAIVTGQRWVAIGDTSNVIVIGEQAGELWTVRPQRGAAFRMNAAEILKSYRHL